MFSKSARYASKFILAIGTVIGHVIYAVLSASNDDRNVPKYHVKVPPTSGRGQLDPPCSQNRHDMLPSLFLQSAQSSVMSYMLSCQRPMTTGTSPNITSKSHPQAVVVNLTPLVLQIGTICFQVYSCNQYSHRSCHICCLVSVQ